MRDGRIVALGHGLAHEGAVVVDASSLWMTPGLIDIHMRPTRRTNHTMC